MLAFAIAMLAAGSAFGQRAPVRATGAAGPIVGVRPEAWSAARTYITNTTDSDTNVLAVLGFDLNSNLQFGREVWSPAHSMIYTWIPFRAPDFTAGPNVILKAETLLLDANASSTDHWLMREQSLMVGQRVQNSNVVAVLSTRDDTDNMVIAARRSIEGAVPGRQPNNATVVSMGADRLCSLPQTLGDFDSLVIGSDIGLLDLAQMQNIRQWVESGKTLWIVAGETNDDQLHMLLGDAWSARTIDRTELQRFSIERDPDTSLVNRHKPVSVSSDEPIELVRMTPGENMTVLERVEGYPAALEFPLGQGRVFVTTLGPAGWAPSPTAPTPALAALADAMFQTDTRAPAAAAKLASSLADLAPAQVGYHVVPRSMVFAVMGIFCAAFLLAGSALLRYGKMEWFAGVGVGLAVAAAGVIHAEAKAVQGATPLTIASAGIERVFPGESAAQVTSSVAVYNPANTAGPIESDTGGMFWPTRGTPVGRLTRLLFTDRDRWHWLNLTVAGGSMLRGDWSASADLSAPLRATAQLDESSVEASVQSGSLGPLDDQLLAGPNGALLVRVAASGAITAADTDLARNDQYVSGSVLTDAQRQHQEIYRQLFAPYSQVAQPTLLGFTNRSIGGVTLPQDAQRRDTLLVSVPIQFIPPASGTTLTIPSAFIPFTVTWMGGSFAYSPMDHRWNPRIAGSPAESLSAMLFAMPRELLPIKLSAMTFDMTIRAPGRDVALVKLVGRTPVPIITVHGPAGVVEAKLTGNDCPAIDAQGRIKLGFTVGLADDSSQNWDISDARLTVTGEKLPREADDAPPFRETPSRAISSGTAP